MAVSGTEIHEAMSELIGEPVGVTIEDTDVPSASFSALLTGHQADHGTQPANRMIFATTAARATRSPGHRRVVRRDLAGSPSTDSHARPAGWVRRRPNELKTRPNEACNERS